MCSSKKIYSSVLILLISTINVGTRACESQYCSTNRDCEPFQLASSKGTICGIRNIPKSGLVECGKDNDNDNNLTCSVPCTVCVNSSYWQTPVCYPLALANAKVCPTVVNDTTIVGSLGNEDQGWETHKNELHSEYCDGISGINGANGVAPYGGRISAWTDNAHGCGKIYSRVMMYFSQINQLAASTRIKSAKLKLLGASEGSGAGFSYYPGYAGQFTNEVLIRRIVGAWNTSTVTWNTQPDTTDVNEVMIPATTLPFSYNVTMDITAMVQDMIDSKMNNGFLFLMKYEEPYRGMTFYFPNQPEIEKRAKLIIDY